MTNYPAPRCVDLGNPCAHDHPLNRDLAGWWLPLPNLVGGRSLFDITGRGGTFTLDSAAQWVPSQNSPVATSSLYGPDDFTSWSSTGTGLGNLTRFRPTTAITIAAWVQKTQGGERYPYLKSAGGINTFPGVQMSINTGDGPVKVRLTTSTTGNVEAFAAGPALANYRWYHACATWDSATGVTVYLDGARLGSTTASGTLTTDTSDPLIGTNMRGRIADVRVYAERRLTDGDVAALYLEGRAGYPTALRRYTPAVWSFPAPVPLVHYTLTADVGAFVLAGVATGLRAARTVPAGTGAFALSGTDAGVRASRVISCEACEFALAGQDATLSKNHPLAADVGEFAITGTDADLRAARTLTADTGTFALAGTAAGSVVSRVVAAEVGDFTLTGTEAGLRAARTLPAAVGAFALSGTDAGARVSRVCAASTGAFSLAGVDAALRAARLTSTEPGAFALAGIDATLSTGRPLAAEVGAFSLAGQPVGLSRTYRLTAGAGEFAIAGANVTLTYTAIPLSRFGIPGRGAANATATGRTGGSAVTGRASSSFTSDGRTGGNVATGRGSGDHPIGGDDGDNDA